MQVIDVLCDNVDVISLLELYQSPVPGIRLHIREHASSLVVERQNRFGILLKSFWCCNILDPVIIPEAAIAPEGGDSALSAYASARQNN